MSLFKDLFGPIDDESKAEENSEDAVKEEYFTQEGPEGGENPDDGIPAGTSDTEVAEENNLADGEAEETAEKPEKSFFKRLKNAEKPSGLYYLRETLSYVLIFILAVILGLLINIYIVRLSRVNGTSMYPTLQNGQYLLTSRLPVIFRDIRRGDVVVFDHTGEVRDFGKDLKEALLDNAIVVLLSGKKSESEESHTYYIKRVIGIEGDVIAFKDNKVYRTTLENLGLEEYIEANNRYNSDPTPANIAAREEIYYKITQKKPDETWEVLDEPYVNSEETPNYKTVEGKYWVVGEGEMFVMGDNRNKSRDGRAIGVMPIDSIMGKVLGEH